MKTTSLSETMSKIEALVRITARIGEIAPTAERYLRAGSPEIVSRGLTALALCRRAGEAVAVACACYGLSAEDLKACATAMTAGKESMEDFTAIVRSKIDAASEERACSTGTPKLAMKESMEIFVSELVLSTALSVGRADHYIKDAALGRVA